MQWTKLSEQTIYENRWFRVNLADVELPDGRHLDHFLIRLRPVAVATAVEMTEAARGMESQRLRDRLRVVRNHLAASGFARADEAAALIDRALRVPL